MRTLPQSSVNTKHIDPVKLIFTAEAIGCDFRDVRIVTAKSECVEKAYDLVVRGSMYGMNSNRITSEAAELINNGVVQITPYVTIADDAFTVCLDVDAITDDTYWEALSMVTEALEKLGDSTGTIYFGKPISFVTSDIPWFYKH